jgi:hypothetical protein
MKPVFAFTILFLCAHVAAAQDYFAAQKKYVNIPSSQTKTSDGIASYINAHYHTDEDKISAIYSWITSNIKYDADSIHYVILDEDNEQRVSFALRRKRGVCENFAAVFNAVAAKCGINSFMVEGFTKQGESIDRSGHVWCIAFVNGEWGLYDPTWDAGLVGSFNQPSGFKYFNADPEIFVQSHLPFDPIYQLLNYPHTYNDFEKGFSAQNNKGKFVNYNDSLSQIKNLDRLSRYAREESRIENAGWPQSRINTKLKRIRFQVEVLNQDDDAELYNSAVSDYNTAIGYYNDFLSYRNNQFRPFKPKDEVEKIFQNVSLSLGLANLKLKKIDSSAATLQLNTGGIKSKLNELEMNLKKQQAFYQNHLAEVFNGK